MLRKSLAFVLAAVLLCAFAGVGAEAAAVEKTIDVIYIRHWGHPPSPEYEYKVDLKEGKLWSFQYEVLKEDSALRDKTAENEGFVFVSDLDEDKIEVFRRKARLYGFDQWREEHRHDLVQGGNCWQITIVYSDETEKTMFGYAAYPLTWNQMHDAFEELTGEKILMGRYWAANLIPIFFIAVPIIMMPILLPVGILQWIVDVFISLWTRISS